MGNILYSCLIDFMVASIQKARKRKLSSFTTKTMVHFCKGCDVHVEEIIEAVSSIAKRWSKMKIRILIMLVIVLNKDLIVL